MRPAGGGQALGVKLIKAQPWLNEETDPLPQGILKRDGPPMKKTASANEPR